MIRHLLAFSFVFFALVSCQPATPELGDPRGRSAAQIDAERAECVTSGGRFANGGLGGLTCFYPASDGGAACTQSSDCEGLCLDNLGVGICTAETPVFGCYAMYAVDEEAVEICID